MAQEVKEEKKYRGFEVEFMDGETTEGHDIVVLGNEGGWIQKVQTFAELTNYLTRQHSRAGFVGIARPGGTKKEGLIMAYPIDKILRYRFDLGVGDLRD